MALFAAPLRSASTPGTMNSGPDQPRREGGRPTIRWMAGIGAGDLGALLRLATRRYHGVAALHPHAAVLRIELRCTPVHADLKPYQGRIEERR